MAGFNKRRYRKFRQFLNDLAYILENRRYIKRVMHGHILSAEFTERLMLAVTSVNKCRYCSYAHTKIALKAGITSKEAHDLLEGEVGSCPSNEITALLYAQHWAESEGKPEPALTEKLVETYGPEESHAIQTILRTISFGNYSGNSFDYLIYKLSFGKINKGRL